MELISIIVPVYNVYLYLEKCVKSLTGQTYQETEILLIDDGSVDGSGSLCDRLAETDERIRVVHQDNQGLSEARNTGIRCAKGDYLCFVDSDDWVADSYCEKLYCALKDGKTGIALCGFGRVESEDEEMPVGNAETIHYQIDEILPWLGDWKSQEYARLVVAWNKLYARDCFEQIRYPAHRLHEDEFIIHRLLATQSTVAVVSQPLYYYRQRPDSIMGKGDYDTNIHHSEVLEAFEDRLQFYQTRNRKAFSDAFHNYMRAANSFYDIYTKQFDRVYQEKAIEILRRYRAFYHTDFRRFRGKEMFQFGLFAYLPKTYSTLCRLKYERKMKRNGKEPVENSN